MDRVINQKLYIVPGGTGHKGANNARGLTMEAKRGKLGTFVVEEKAGRMRQWRTPSIVVHNREGRA